MCNQVGPNRLKWKIILQYTDSCVIWHWAQAHLAFKAAIGKILAEAVSWTLYSCFPHVKNVISKTVSYLIYFNLDAILFIFLARRVSLNRKEKWSAAMHPSSLSHSAPVFAQWMRLPPHFVVAQ